MNQVCESSGRQYEKYWQTEKKIVAENCAEDLEYVVEFDLYELSKW